MATRGVDVENVAGKSGNNAAKEDTGPYEAMPAQGKPIGGKPPTAARYMAGSRCVFLPYWNPRSCAGP